MFLDNISRRMSPRQRATAINLTRQPARAPILTPEEAGPIWPEEPHKASATGHCREKRLSSLEATVRNAWT